MTTTMQATPFHNQNSDTFPFYGELGTTNLDSLTGAHYGVYRQSESGNVYSGLNYPLDAPGSLLVLLSREDGCTQEYRPYSSNVLYRRRYFRGSFMWSWSSWCQEYNSENPPPNPINTAVPVGAIMLWASTVVPAGWLACDGSAFSQANYPSLVTVYPEGKLPSLSCQTSREARYIIKATL